MVFRDYDKLYDIKDLFGKQPEERRLDTKINELDSEYVVEVTLVGFDKDEIIIFIEDDSLFIEANREDIIDAEDEEYAIQERSYAYCQKSFSLEGIDRKGITAYYENDLVYIHLPKLKVE